MASVGDKRGRDDVDDKANKTVEVTSSDEELTDEEPTEDYSSKGFDDVPEYGGSSIPGGIGPYEIVNHYSKRLVIILAIRCLRFYNDHKRASFEFDKLVRVNRQGVGAGLMYYITFTARCGNPSQTFHGKVWRKLNNSIVVKFCEMAIMQESGTSQESGPPQEVSPSQEAGGEASSSQEAGVEAGTPQETGTSQA